MKDHFEDKKRTIYLMKRKKKGSTSSKLHAFIIENQERSQNKFLYSKEDKESGDTKREYKTRETLIKEGNIVLLL
jgi:hypothetical protein